jgi:hypothetical protein
MGHLIGDYIFDELYSFLGRNYGRKGNGDESETLYDGVSGHIALGGKHFGGRRYLSYEILPTR